MGIGPRDYRRYRGNVQHTVQVTNRKIAKSCKMLMHLKKQHYIHDTGSR